ncbi:hypothetical protein, conserved [Trypanosoma brucei brucei TREU927]|uniref:Uncharacterized protein n=1 Tax=Trypanosoma brucei brucei (strain 927/4 GUTat10.1) TaxID=185431 RepID=Q38CT9_TRYB2|nr:hypothetical protein, conserved [Trypanosoma brucei brucei TREU927]XP_827711.1 hypothetical protein, conserved [Trypanosoma brucei brucei TREU927]XP_827714.1 hypothetical protein, conserved [Trypanosoma brucei brucei TREU927]EAN77378.1 hypothetical protein, conserved [Trypanosoma brucei brucei TREU927]EAN77381.1 hypothetical protein, conserved [Trypanosoma brucei brucei TREU927]EAN77384.1 hypothetical protein, conserved [Trypanosoma brucei brucei TREU927]
MSNLTVSTNKGNYGKAYIVKLWHVNLIKTCQSEERMPFRVIRKQSHESVIDTITLLQSDTNTSKTQIIIMGASQELPVKVKLLLIIIVRVALDTNAKTVSTVQRPRAQTVKQDESWSTVRL